MANKRNCLFNKVFDPSEEFILRWNNLMFVVGLINFYIDPMFMYLPTFNNSRSIVNLDLRLGTTLALLRCVGDLFLMLGIVVKFRTAYEAPGSRVFVRRRLIEDPRRIAIKYLRSTFIIDLLAALPVPQAYMWSRILASEAELISKRDIRRYGCMCVIIWIQLLPRLFVVVHSKNEITKTAGILMKSAMSGAFYNLLWFVNHSNIFGSMYYYLHFFWLLRCMKVAKQEDLNSKTVEWDQIVSNCAEDNDIAMGMFSSALTNKIMMRNFIQKYMFCFSWGFKSLSSLGQNFTTSFDIWETTFSIAINLYGLIFLADLITWMQAGIQSMEENEEQQRTRQREIKEWMDYHQLPLSLKERIDHLIQSEWSENRINDETMLDSLPMDLRSEIRRFLYMELVCKLPKFADMDSQLVEAICQHLRTFSSREGTYIVYEGDLLKQVLFIFSGQLEISFRESGSSSSTILGPGDICGQELVTWASLSTTTLQSLPSSTLTMKCLTDVEAFTLQAYNLKILATQFAHNQEFQHAFKQHYP